MTMLTDIFRNFASKPTKPTKIHGYLLSTRQMYTSTNINILLMDVTL